MKIYLGSDHGGFPLKQKLVAFLQKEGFFVKDFGPLQLDLQDDYPDFVVPVAKAVAKEHGSLGVVLCRNGQGVCIVCNKVKGIRAVTGFSLKMVKSTKADDNANVLCLPADYLSEKEAKGMVLTWINEPFSGQERHLRRLRKVALLEK